LPVPLSATGRRGLPGESTRASQSSAHLNQPDLGVRMGDDVGLTSSGSYDRQRTAARVSRDGTEMLAAR
jgi:hypothetical protein